MTAWVGALSAEGASNWELCKQFKLWGSPSHRAASVVRGDELFLWQAKRGWIARCVVTASAKPAAGERIPWPEPGRYRHIFGIDLVRELSPAWFMSGAELKRQVGLHTIQLAQFPKLTGTGAEYLDQGFARLT